MRILNITNHAPIEEQYRAGVVDNPSTELKELLTFDDIPDKSEIERRAARLADMAKGYDGAMIGGATYLMSALESELKARGVRVFHAFTKREVISRWTPDGVEKNSVFVFLGFVEV